MYYPLLDLKASWEELHHTLTFLLESTERHLEISEQNWAEMAALRDRLSLARVVLGTLPPDILSGIAAEEEEWNRMEDLADGLNT